MTGIGWFTIMRLGLVNMALGSFVVLATAMLNRVMVVEIGMLAAIPAGLVALFRMVQITRARWGYDSDKGGARTPWIIGGMMVLGLGGVLASAATALMATQAVLGMALAVLAFVLMGLGAGASGTCFLALLATRVRPQRRAAAATIVWMMMIFGIVLTAAGAGALLEPFTFSRLVTVTAIVAIIACLATVLGVWGVERRTVSVAQASVTAEGVPDSFAETMREVWAEPSSRFLTIFIFVSMLAFSAQDLILEPFAGLVFGMTPGESTQLSGTQHQGVFLGMALVGILGSGFGIGSLRIWTVLGCLASATALSALAIGGYADANWPLKANVFALGFANGIFAVGAIGCMMGLASAGSAGREGARMGMWGAAQAMAFALGGMIGAVAVDVMRALLDSTVQAYALVFGAEAALFAVSAILALSLREAHQQSPDFQAAIVAGE